MTALCQKWQMFGDVDSRSPRGNGAKFPADGSGDFGFRIEGIVLWRSARKKDEDHRLGSPRFPRCRVGSAHRPQRVEVLNSQAEHSHASGLQQRASRKAGMNRLEP